MILKMCSSNLIDSIDIDMVNFHIAAQNYNGSVFLGHFSPGSELAAC